jgi:tRNA dimethylallyltransferase
VIAVVGPTAAGKSALSIALAHALGGEVVNADSMQLYRGMDIGTAKLTPAERAGVPHHCLDIWDVTEPASVAGYQRLARAAVDDIAARGRVPLLVGGSGLYVRAVLEEFEFPGTDPVVRARLEAELAEAGPAPLHRRLAVAETAGASSARWRSSS